MFLPRKTHSSSHPPSPNLLCGTTFYWSGPCSPLQMDLSPLLSSGHAELLKFYNHAMLNHKSMSLHTLRLVHTVLCPEHSLPALFLSLGNSYFKKPSSEVPCRGEPFTNSVVVLLNCPSLASHGTLYTPLMEQSYHTRLNYLLLYLTPSPEKKNSVLFSTIFLAHNRSLYCLLGLP